MFPWYLWFSWRDLQSFPFFCFPLFLCIDRWRRLSYLFLLFFETLYSDAYIFPFLLCFSLLFFSQLFVRPPQNYHMIQQFRCKILFYCSVSQSCLTLCNTMDCSMPGFPVLHHLQELAQTHVHWVSDIIQPSHLLLSPSPPAWKQIFPKNGI